jgi:hypothetical protein
VTMKLAIHHIDGNPLNNDPANLRRVRVATNPRSPEKRPPGRPPLAPDRAKSVVLHVRVTQAEAEKFERLGASEWLRRALSRARP